MNKKIIHTVIEKEVVRVPQRIAVEEENRRLTYMELNGKANQLAHLLRGMGIKREHVAGTMMPSSINLVISILAIFKSGGVYLPIDAAFARKRLRQMFTQSPPEVLITSESVRMETEALLKELDVCIPYLIGLSETHDFTLYQFCNGGFVPMDLSAKTYSVENPELVTDAEDGNYIFYTSGSTGEAKAFLGRHKSLSHFIHWEKKEFGVDETFKVSQLAQFTFDASLRDILLPLAAGGTICIPSAETKTNMMNLCEWIEASQINLIHCVPSVFRLLTKELVANQRNCTFPELKYVLMAGEALYGKDILNWRQAVGEHVEIVNLYGTSETTLAKTFHRIHNLPTDPAQALHVGKPIDNAAVLILNDGIPCSVGETGEIYIRTPFRTKGYYKDEVLNQTRFVQNPLINYPDILHRTGDLGRFTAEMNVEVVGRADDQVKVNGIRIELGEVKQAVLSMAGITEAEILVKTNGNHQNELICYYVGPSVETDALRLFLQTELNAAVMPVYFVKMARFPLTANGKVDKKALPQPEEMMETEVYAAPQTEVEKNLEAFWMEVIGLKRVSRDASFFKVGGTSLKAIHFISKVYKKYGVGIKINDIFANPTIAKLADLIISGKKAAIEDIQPVPAQACYDLTPAQHRLWIVDQFEKEQAAYNIPKAYLFEGDFNPQALMQAFDALIERHEILRTTFVLVDGQPKQKIHHFADFAFQVTQVDLRTTFDALQTAQWMVADDALQPFDLVNGPLLRASLLQTADHAFVFLFNTHHIICDGWSFELMTKELLHLYRTFTAGKTPSLAPLNIQYKDYAAWLKTQLSGEKLKSHRQYWLKQFEGELPVLQMPADFPRATTRTTNGAIRVFEIEATLSQALRNMAKEQQASMYMTLLASVNVWLARYSGQYDLVIGSPIAGRVHKDLEDQIGLYVNLLAIRTQLQPEESFLDLLRKVKVNTLGAYEHQVYPFDQLVKELNLHHDSRHSALTDVWVQHSDSHWAQLTDPDGKMAGTSNVTIKPFDAAYSISKVDLTFKFTETGDTIEVILEYNTDLYRASTAERMQDDFLQLLNLLTRYPESKLINLFREMSLAMEAEQAFIDEVISTEY